MDYLKPYRDRKVDFISQKKNLKSSARTMANTSFQTG